MKVVDCLIYVLTNSSACLTLICFGAFSVANHLLSMLSRISAAFFVAYVINMLGQ